MKSAAPALGAIAATVQRVGVLLAAGVTPAAVWSYLAEDPAADSVARSISAGVSIPDAIADAGRGRTADERQLWAAVAAAWAVAADAGSPLAATLLELSAAIRDLAQSQRDITVALASPAATARLVLVLPAIGLVFGTLLGFNTLGTLLTTPIGWCCLVVGSSLLYAAARWNRRMVRSALPREQTPGLELELLAIGISGGGAIDRARASVSEVLARYSISAARGDSAVDIVLELSRRAGVPAAALLRSEAAESRRAARSEAAEAAQALSVRLMIPLGVCVLPSFMLLSVVPLVVTVLSSISLAW
ncbi:MAG TPA: type II secretion system F family protein [Galbitalea sp.]|nr:type II secretion system F family protein [Galbitalea sp.]